MSQAEHIDGVSQEVYRMLLILQIFYQTIYINFVRCFMAVFSWLWFSCDWSWSWDVKCGCTSTQAPYCYWQKHETYYGNKLLPCKLMGKNSLYLMLVDGWSGSDARGYIISFLRVWMVPPGSYFLLYFFAFFIAFLFLLSTQFVQYRKILSENILFASYLPTYRK